MTDQAPSTTAASTQAPSTKALAEIDALITRFFSVIDNRGDKAPAYQDFTPLFVQTVMIYKRQGDTIEAMDLDTFLTPRIALLNDGTLGLAQKLIDIMDSQSPLGQGVRRANSKLFNRRTTQS
jgi:hypothetical protein